jgi:hypothetical protein
MDACARGFICDLHLAVGQRLPRWIPDDAYDAARTRSLGVAKRSSTQQGNRSEQPESPGETERGVGIQDRKPSLRNLHGTSLDSFHYFPVSNSRQHFAS